MSPVHCCPSRSIAQWVWWDISILCSAVVQSQFFQSHHPNYRYCNIVWLITVVQSPISLVSSFLDDGMKLDWTLNLLANEATITLFLINNYKTSFSKFCFSKTTWRVTIKKRSTQSHWIAFPGLGQHKKKKKKWETHLDCERHAQIFLSLWVCGVFLNSQLTVRLQAEWPLRSERSSPESHFHNLFGRGAQRAHNQHLCAYKYTHARIRPCCTCTHGRCTCTVWQWRVACR